MPTNQMSLSNRLAKTSCNVEQPQPEQIGQKDDQILHSPRIKRPSISIEIFNATWVARLRWAIIASIPLFVTLSSRSTGPLVSLSFAIVAGLAANASIPSFGKLLLHAGRKGLDLNKPNRPTLPESLGIAVGAIYLITLFLYIPIPFAPWLRAAATHTDHYPQTLLLSFPFEKLGAYTAALLSITCMLFLGFADDVLNLKWRHKILIPAISSLPLLMIYSVTCGRTEVVVPLPLRPLLNQPLLDLGLFYYAYMALLAIFCTHSINILAGVNGVEVGQSVVIAASIALHNVAAIRAGEPVDLHYFSLSLILPFLAVSLGLLRHNWWPAGVFVGDTYCYFGGMTFAVVGILGHFGKTLLLFFLPQIFNFIYSLPQLTAIIPCPRHRMPTLTAVEEGNENSLTMGMILKPSTVQFEITPKNVKIVSLLIQLRLLQVYKREQKGDVGSSDKKVNIIETNNLTLLNLLLVKLGPMREDRLTIVVLLLQVACSVAAFMIRHYLAQFVFP